MSKPVQNFGAAPHERPVPRISIHAFCEFPDTGAALQRAGGDRRLSKAHLQVQLGGVTAAVEHYRSHFVPGRIETPRTILALGVICAASDSEAERLFASTRLFRRRIRQGDLRPIPPPDEALRELGAARDPIVQSEWPRYVVGAPDTVTLRLTAIAEQLRIDELMAITVIHDHAARLRSYELLARCFELVPRAL